MLGPQRALAQRRSVGVAETRDLEAVNMEDVSSGRTKKRGEKAMTMSTVLSPISSVDAAKTFLPV